MAAEPGTTIVFACADGCRALMATAIFAQLASRQGLSAVAAGSRPVRPIPRAITDALREVHLELVAPPVALTTSVLAGATLLVTMDVDLVPEVRGLRRHDWIVADPIGHGLEMVRAIRAELGWRVGDLVGREGWRRGTSEA